MENYNEYFESNKDIWNQRTAVHKNSSFYDLAGFKAGKDVLTPIELREVGDVNGKSMLHLQCHFGMDSLNWSRKGAIVTGVDLSDNAIEEARNLNEELGLHARFISSNVYDLHPSGNSPIDGEQFDIIFCSYGVVGWLPDLNRWAEIISHYLKPGGFFYLAEFHPIVWMFDDEFTKIQYSYENRELIVTENYGTYTDRKAAITGKEYSWNHSLSEVINALIGQGLKLQHLNEFMYSPYPNFRNTVQGKDGNWYIKGMEGKIPMVYSVKAVKK